MEILIANKCDVEEILPIFRELEEYYFGKHAASIADIRDYFLKQVFSNDSGVTVVIAKNNGVVLGFATFTIMYPAPKLSGQAYMKDLFTSSTVRGQGVGKSIMKFIAAYALKRGCNRLDWTAEMSNPTAGVFYKAIGASQIHEKQYFRFEGKQLEEFSKN